MKNTGKLSLLILLALMNFNSSCNNGTPKDGGDSTKKVVVITPPDFNADNAYLWVKSQVDFSPRIPGTAAQKNCAAWLEKKLRQYCSDVIVQKTDVTIYDGTKKPCINLTASFNPKQTKRILLFTHWDTRPWSDRDEKEPKKQFDGADDGGSGVAVLLEIARAIHEKNCNVGIDILLEDVEDFGPPDFEQGKWNEGDSYCLGTQYWCNDARSKNYHAYYGILLDMVGSKNAKFYLDPTAPDISQHIFEAAQTLGYSNYFIMQMAPGGITDDNFYVNKILQIPAADIIALDLGSKYTFAKHWHTQQDNISLIDKLTLKAVGQTLLQVIYNEPVDAVN